MTTLRSLSRRLLGLAAAACVVAGCHQSGTPRVEAGDDQPPGAVISEAKANHSYPALVTFTRDVFEMRYKSTSDDGTTSTVSGVVFVPPGEPPPGGWPIAAIGHPTTGVTTECAPSSYPALLGGVPAVAQFLASGFVVTLTDYRGLGLPGPHPYLDPITAAHNMIDATRAARQLVPQASDAWVAYGVSQGGQAAWAANEASGDYGAGLRLLGSVSIAPPTDLRPIVDAMENGKITDSQMMILPLILIGLQVAHPELNMDDYLHGIMRERLDVFMTCTGEQDMLKSLVVESASPEDVKPSSPQAADRLRDWLGGYSVPQRPAPAPMFVAYGDVDDLVLPAWTEAGVRQACALGDVIELVVAPGQGHGTLDLGNAPRAWIQDRLAGLPPPNTC